MATFANLFCLFVRTLRMGGGFCGNFSVDIGGNSYRGMLGTANSTTFCNISKRSELLAYSSWRQSTMH